MATPTKKAAALEGFLDETLKMINPDTKGRRGSISANVCSMCSAPAVEFKDELSKREYTISGACQKCQDVLFMDFDKEAE